MAFLQRGILLVVTVLAGAQETLDLQQWLKSVTFNFPAGSYIVALPKVPTLGQLDLNITVLPGSYCEHIMLRDVQVHSVTSDAHSFATNFSIEDLGIHCHLVSETSLHSGSNLGTGRINWDFQLANSTLDSAFELNLTDAVPPLPDSMHASLCSLRASVTYSYVGETVAGRSIAALLDFAEPFIDAPAIVNTAFCSALELFTDDLTKLGFRALQNWVEAHDALQPSESLPEIPLTGAATHLDEFFVTGTMGSVIQSILHDGVTDFTDPDLSALSTLFSQLAAVAIPNLPFSIEELLSRGVVVTVPFLGTLGLSAVVPNCSTPGLPSPLATGSAQRHSIEVGLGSVSGACTVDLKLNLTIGGSISGGMLGMQMELGMAVTHFKLSGSALLGIRGNRLVNGLTVDQLTHPNCLARTLDSYQLSPNASVKLLAAGGDLQGLDLRMKAAGFKQPLLNAILQATSSWVSSAAVPLLPGVVALLNGGGGAFIRDELNALLNHTMADVGECPASLFHADQKPHVANSFGSIGLVSAAVAAVGILAYLIALFRRWAAKLEAAQSHSQGARPLVDHSEATAQSEEMPRALVAHKAVGRSEAIALLAVIVSSMALFAYALSSLFMRVAFSFEDSDPSSGPHSQSWTGMLDITYPSMAVMMWQEGGWYLTLCCALLSFALPPLKYLLFLGCLLAPPSRLSPALREKILSNHVLIQKISLAEGFLMALMLTAMHTLDWKDTTAAGSDDFIFGVEGREGYFAFVLVTFMNMIIGQVLVGLNTRAQTSDRKKKGVTHLEHALEWGQTVAVPIARRAICQGENSFWLHALTWLVLLAAPCLITAGLVMESFNSTYYGAIGIVRVLLASTVTDHRSVFNIIANFPWPPQNELLSTLGVTVLVLLLTWFVLLAPLLHCFCMLVTWAAPMTTLSRQRFLSFEQALYNWQSLDVFVLVLIFVVVLGTRMFVVLGAIIHKHSAWQFLCLPLQDSTGVRCIDIHIGYGPGLFVLTLGVVMQTAAMALLRKQSAWSDSERRATIPVVGK